MFTKTYTREHIINALILYQTLGSFRKVEKQIGISKSTIHRWWHCPFALGIRKKRGKKQKRQRTKTKFPNIIEDLKDIFNTKDLKYLSLQCIRKKLNYSKPVSLSWLATCLRKAKISRRRFSKLCNVKGPDKQVLMMKTKSFIDFIKDIPNEEIACIDESSFSNVANSFYGYFKKGQQPIAIEVKQREKMSCIAAISSTSYICYEMQKGSYNSPTFYDFIENTLIPFLPSTIKYILMDNIGFHKSVRIQTLLQNHNLQTIFIPPYSPKYDPIEEFFSMLKNRFRTIYLETRDFENSIYNAFETLSTANTLSFYTHLRDHVDEFRKLKL